MIFRCNWQRLWICICFLALGTTLGWKGIPISLCKIWRVCRIVRVYSQYFPVLMIIRVLHFGNAFASFILPKFQGSYPEIIWNHCLLFACMFNSILFIPIQFYSFQFLVQIDSGPHDPHPVRGHSHHWNLALQSWKGTGAVHVWARVLDVSSESTPSRRIPARLAGRTAVLRIWATHRRCSHGKGCLQCIFTYIHQRCFQSFRLITLVLS